MARPPEPHIRARLRDQAVHYVLAHGIRDLALRPLAQALKTNARMLVYHFGSREGLMQILSAYVLSETPASAPGSSAPKNRAPFPIFCGGIGSK